jgi:hypothetical protein
MKIAAKLCAGLLLVCALAGAPPARAALPVDACTPPSGYPSGPGLNQDSVTFTAYDKSTAAFVVRFWRQPCFGSSTKSLLWARFPCGTHDFGFAMLQEGPLGTVEYRVILNGGCGVGSTATTTFLIEQSAQETMFRNSGAVTLIHRGGVLSWGALPAYGTDLKPSVGLWWNPSEPGSGYAIDVKNGTLVLTVYSYTADGAVQWYIASGPLTNGGRNFSGVLEKARGGQCISCPFTGPPVSDGNDGPVEIRFSSSTSATMTLPGGRVTNIEPEPF